MIARGIRVGRREILKEREGKVRIAKKGKHQSGNRNRLGSIVVKDGGFGSHSEGSFLRIVLIIIILNLPI